MCCFVNAVSEKMTRRKVCPVQGCSSTSLSDERLFLFRFPRDVERFIIMKQVSTMGNGLRLFATFWKARGLSGYTIHGIECVAGTSKRAVLLLRKWRNAYVLMLHPHLILIMQEYRPWEALHNSRYLLFMSSRYFQVRKC